MLSNEQRKEIEEELSKYSSKLIEEFQIVLPLQLSYSHGIHNYYVQNIIPKEGPLYRTNLYLVYDHPYETFWERWNRFKNLKAFL